jgi:long-chain fatty acid transport protein
MRTSCFRLLVVTLAVMVGLAGELTAAGFETINVSPKALSLADSTTARTEDLSAFYSNPAGLALLGGHRISFGMNVHLSDFSWKPAEESGRRDISLTETTNNPRSFSYHFAYAVDFGQDKFGLGLGAFSPYHFRSSWSESGENRHNITVFELNNYFITLGGGYRPHQRVALGVSLVYAPTELSFRSRTDLSEYIQLVETGDPNILDKLAEREASSESRFSIDYRDTGALGWLAGVWIKAHRRVQLGLAYQPKIKLTLEGVAKMRPPYNPDVINYRFLIPPPGGGNPQDYYFFTSHNEMELYLPSQARFGLHVWATKKANISADVSFTRWTDLEDSAFKDPRLDGTLFSFHPPMFSKWEDTWRVSFGTEYAPKESSIFRLGYFYDQSAIPSQYLEGGLISGRHQGLSFGAGLEIGDNLVLDFGYCHIWMSKRTVTFSEYQDRPESATANEKVLGKYRNSWELISLSFTYHIGEKKKKEYGFEPVVKIAAPEPAPEPETPRTDEEEDEDKEDSFF